MKLETARDREVWNAAIAAAAAACRLVEQAGVGQGHRMRRPTLFTEQPRNPHSHLSGEIRLGAARCLTEVSNLRVAEPVT